MDNRSKGTLLTIIAVLYFLSPLDLLPGLLIDDIAFAVFAYLMNHKNTPEKEDDDYGN